MSYSFTVSAPTKSDAADKVFTALTEVCGSQPIHGADSKQAHEAATAFINMLAEPGEDQQVIVTVNGSLSWFGGDADSKPPISGASIGVNAYLGPNQK